MLRNRSKVVTKQSPIMGDHQTTSSLSPNTQNPTRPVSSFLNSPKFLFLSRIISPTSILEKDKKIYNFENNPFRFTKNPEKPINNFEKFKPNSENFDPEGIALAIALVQEKNDPNAQKLLFKSKLKIQIPSLDPFPNGSPESPGDFGIKTRNSQFSGAPTPTGFGFGSPKYTTGPLSLREMELSEEYTRVISHGPNPKTTHIYDNCVVDSCCGIRVGSPPESFVSFCQTCKKKIGADNDIFIYRGEKAFCSEECRCQEMILDGLMTSTMLNSVEY